MLTYYQFKENSNYLLEPSHFKNHEPFGCIFKEKASEHETIAKNIMVILSRTGNVFRNLSWKEYKEEREKDDNFTEQEKYFFNRVNRYCSSSENATKFSPNWKNILEKEADKYNL